MESRLNAFSLRNSVNYVSPVNMAAALFTWTDYEPHFGYKMYSKCKLIKDIGPFSAGDEFKKIWIYNGSGTIQFVNDRVHTLSRMLPKDQPYGDLYTFADWHIFQSKRRRLNPVEDDCYLIGDHVYSKNVVVTRIQQAFKQSYWSSGDMIKYSFRSGWHKPAAGKGYRKLSGTYKRVAGKSD